MLEWAIVVSTLLSPLIAVQVQKSIERWREATDRRQRVFKTLMATRASVLSPSHIEALNLIDLEFPSTNKQFKKVSSAWKAYLTNLIEPTPTDKQLAAVSQSKRTDLLTDLLYEMGLSLGYEFDKTHISKGGYSTVYHGQVEAEGNLIRQKFLELLTGNSPLKISMVDPTLAAQQADSLKLVSELLKAGKPVTITLGTDSSGKVVPLRVVEPKSDLPNQHASGGSSHG